MGRPRIHGSTAARYAAYRSGTGRDIRTAIRALIDAAKSVPCADCGGTFDPVCMDFDHRDPSTKLIKVSRFRTLRARPDVVLAEIAKCDVVCSNCHRLRTKRRGDHLIPTRRNADDG